jgi:hypothetical protein
MIRIRKTEAAPDLAKISERISIRKPFQSLIELPVCPATVCTILFLYFKVAETVTLVSSSEESTKVKPVEGSGSADETNPVDGSTSDKKAGAAAAVNISAESSHTTNEKIHAASEMQSSSIIRQDGIEKVDTLCCISNFLFFVVPYRTCKKYVKKILV